jgi:hypothetical protein
MASQTNVSVREQVWLGEAGEWRLGLQWCLYVHPQAEPEEGYRFIWQRPEGSLQAARGQARLPSLAVVGRLVAMAEAAGWGDKLASDANRFE